MKKLLAKPISYAPQIRVYDQVKYIVIHNTGNKNDTAINNAKYFAYTNKNQAGAHIFIDRDGNVIKSITFNHIAYAVGGKKYSDCNKTGGGKLYGKVTNSNSVSIELCDIVDQYPSEKQLKAIKKTIKTIRKSCPNAKTVVRHFDVNGKHCPQIMMGEKTWNIFLKDIGEGK